MSEMKQKDATLNDVVVALQKSQEVLEDMAAWIKVGNFENVRIFLTSTFKKPEERIVYNLSDGRSTREINAACGVSLGSISNYQNNWNKMGLMKTTSVTRGDRYIKKFNLEDFGIEIPKQSDKKTSQPQITTESQTASGQPKTEAKPIDN